MKIDPGSLTAVILCGGKGERLRPFTDKFPKPLVPLLDKPLLLHLVEFLKLQGIRKFVFCVGYKAEMIEEYVHSNIAGPDVEVHLSNAGDVSITRRLALASPHIHGPALVCYGDTIANVSLNQLCHFHNTHEAEATITVFPLRSQFGIVDIAGNMAVGFREKPDLPYHINIGFFILSRAIIGSVHNYDEMIPWLESLTRDNNLSAYIHKGKHLTVNTEKERQSAEEEIIELYTL
jgi:NDP-sugar pyrophosphorylase family protein